MGDGTGVVTKPIMFLSSYAPLLMILAIRFDGLGIQATCLLLAVAGILGLFILMHFQHEDRSQQGRYTLKDVRQAGEGASSYLASYLLPFVMIDSPSVWDLVAYGGFFFVAYVVTVNTGIIQVNPTLFCLGYRIYFVTDHEGAQRYLIGKSRAMITKDATVLASRMTNDVLLFEEVITQ